MRTDTARAGYALMTALLLGAIATARPDPACAQSGPMPKQSIVRAKIIAKQGPDQYLASKMRGVWMFGPGNTKLGSVTDVLFQDNKVVAFVFGNGGFLGIGERDIAITPASFRSFLIIDRSMKMEGYSRLELNATKEDLKSAPEFVPRDRQRH